MKPKVFLFVFLKFMCLASMADEYISWVPVGNVVYNLNTTKQTAEVRSCDNVVSITIPSSITYKNVTYTVTHILAGALDQRTALTSITLPEGLKSIGESAFYNCSSLKSIVIPSSVNNIGINILSCCISLTSIKVASGNNTYDSRNDCNAIIETHANRLIAGCMNSVIPHGVLSIEWGAFNNCVGLKSITIPNTVTKIGGSAFNACSALTSIVIPKSVTSIESGAFSRCTSLMNITIGNSKAVIGSGAFDDTAWLESQPDGLLYIGEYAYKYKGTMPTLSEIVITEGTKGICGGAFNDCNNLSSIILPNSLTFIETQAFRRCSGLTSIIIPENVNNIGDFAFYSCNNLVNVTVRSEIPAKIFSYTFSNAANATLYVPLGSKAVYESANYWNSFKSIVERTEDTPISSLDNVVYLNKIDGIAGQEQTLSFQMKNSASIRGFQFDLYLPKGVTAVKNAKGRIQGALSNGRLPEDDEHSLTIQEQAEGCIRFLCSSLYDETFTGSEGEIATLQVKIGESVEDGNYPIIIKDMKLTETNISSFYETSYLKSTLTIYSYTLGDINGDTKVDVSDYTGVANHILGIAQEVFIEKTGDVDGSGTIDVSDYTGIANYIMTGSFFGRNHLRKAEGLAGRAGENVIYVQDSEITLADASGAEVELSIRMRNTADIRGFQFDMYLPEGFTVMKNNKGRIIASLSSGRRLEGDEHTLRVQEQTDGGIRFLCSSLYDDTFTGTDGEIATVKVKIVDNIAANSYSIQLKNIKLTETNISNYYETELMESVFRMTGGEPQTEGGEDAVVEVKAMPVMIQTQGGTITVQGLAEGTNVSVYGVNGMLQGSDIAEKGIAILNTSLRPSSVAVVRIGKKSIKVLMK